MRQHISKKRGITCDSKCENNLYMVIFPNSASGTLVPLGQSGTGLQLPPGAKCHRQDYRRQTGTQTKLPIYLYASPHAKI